MTLGIISSSAFGMADAIGLALTSGNAWSSFEPTMMWTGALTPARLAFVMAGSSYMANERPTGFTLLGGSAHATVTTDSAATTMTRVGRIVLMRPRKVTSSCTTLSASSRTRETRQD